MPRTKLDALAKKPTAMQKKKRIVKTAFADKLKICVQKDMALAVGMNPAAFSRSLNIKMSEQTVYKLHALLNFTDEQLEELLCTK